MSIGQVIEAGGEKLAIYVPASSWSDGLHFVTEEVDYLQVGMWKYARGKILQAHIHNEVKRESIRTQELITVRTGRVAAFIYDEEENLVMNLELGPGDFLVLLRGGHGYEILEDNTEVLEIKNGPYIGAEIDRRRIV